MTQNTLKRYRFFRKHAGYVVGRRAQGALDLARAEALLDAAETADVASLEWYDDDDPYDLGDICAEAGAAEKFATNEWTGPYGAVLTINGHHAASLWGIVVGPNGTADPYCRVVAAELATEAADKLAAALAATREGAGIA